MSRCSWLLIIVRWWRRDPCYGHEIMWPQRVSGDMVLQCARCLRAWRVQA